MNRKKKKTNPLREAFFDIFARTGTPCVSVKLNKPGAPLPVGASKFGGLPDVPQDFEWPCYESKGGAYTALSFLAQVNLAEASRSDQEEILPKSGMLYFFYDLENTPWGHDVYDRGCGQVFYVEEGTPLTRIALPEDEEDDVVEPVLVPEIPLSFAKLILPEFEVSLDGDNPFETLCKGDDEQVWHTFYDLRCDYIEESGALLFGSYLLGVPDEIQGPMERECGSLARKSGLVDRETDDWSWRLLFQLSSSDSEEGDIILGDCATLYFWIRESDLLKRDFSKVWVMVQSY